MINEALRMRRAETISRVINRLMCARLLGFITPNECANACHRIHEAYKEELSC